MPRMEFVTPEIQLDSYRPDDTVDGVRAQWRAREANSGGETNEGIGVQLKDEQPFPPGPPRGP
jgi:hypothetical protein